jgi:hypothetical protein
MHAKTIRRLEALQTIGMKAFVCMLKEGFLSSSRTARGWRSLCRHNQLVGWVLDKSYSAMSGAGEGDGSGTINELVVFFPMRRSIYYMAM